MELNQIPRKPPGLKVYAAQTEVALTNPYFDYVTVARRKRELSPKFPRVSFRKPSYNMAKRLKLYCFP